MITITTNQIKARLAQSFNDVRDLRPIPTDGPKNSDRTRISSNISFEGITLVVGTFIGERYFEPADSNNSFWGDRFVHIPQTNDTYTF